MKTKTLDKIQETAEFMNELEEFENMPTTEVPMMDWQAWFQYQEDIVKSAEEVTNA